MTSIRPYLVAAIALLLLAGPWLQTAEATTAPEKTYCDCCNGPCAGCCCSMPEAPDNSGPLHDKDGCTCEMSDLPALPSLPMNVYEHRLEVKSALIDKTPPVQAALGSEPAAYTITWDKSPPAPPPRPAYVRFSAFLI